MKVENPKLNLLKCDSVRCLGLFFPLFFSSFYAFQFYLHSGLVKYKEQIYDKVILEYRFRLFTIILFGENSSRCFICVGLRVAKY